MKDARPYPWRLFFLLLSGALVGAAAIIPYSLALSAELLRRSPPPLPLWLLIALQVTQSVILLTIAVGVGLLAARPLGLGAPLLENWVYKRRQVVAWRGLAISASAGVVLGVVTVVIARVVFLPRIPQLAALEITLPLWKRLLACFYGAMDEEILMRLFLLSGVLWLLAKIRHIGDVKNAPGIFWAANFFVALLFGAGHLPAAMLVTPINAITLLYIMSLNGFASLLFGYLYWRRGLEAAMIAHFSGDLVLHVIAPQLVR